MGDESCTGAVANYFLLKERKKPETRVEVEKVPPVKEAVLDILSEDRDFWKESGQKQPGMEKTVLLGKVSNKVSINSNVFEIATYELEIEQLILSFVDGQFKRYILLELPTR